MITDLLLPELDGVAVTQRILARIPETKVVVLSSVSDQDQSVVRAIRAGAISYVMNSADLAELVRTIRQAAAGQVHLSSRVAARLMREVQSPPHVTLTEREREVLRGIALGRTDNKIAGSPNVALSTVKSHVRSILDKLGVDSRTQAAVHVLRHQTFASDELRVA